MLREDSAADSVVMLREGAGRKDAEPTVPSAWSELRVQSRRHEGDRCMSGDALEGKQLVFKVGWGWGVLWGN